MKEIWTKSWKKVLVWVCGYVGILAFAIAGGYVIVKSEDAELHRTAKQCFIVTLAFLAADALLVVLTYIGSLANIAAAGSGYTVFLGWASFLLELAKIGVYATVIVMTLVNARGEEDAPPAEEADEAAAKPAQEENAAQK